MGKPLHPPLRVDAPVGGNAWIEMATVLNEVARSMGQRDFYPFVMSASVVAKLQFIHLVVKTAGGHTVPAAPPSV